MNILSFFIDSLQLPPNYVIEAHIINSLDVLAPYCVIKIKDASGVFESKIKYGSNIIAYVEDDKGKRIFDYTFNVISYDKVSMSNGTHVEDLLIKAVSEYVFAQQPLKRAFFGTVSSVIKEALKDDSFFKKKYIDDSTEVPQVRYQIYEETKSFIHRLSAYGMKDTSTLFLYSSLKKELYYRAYSSLTKGAPVLECIPYQKEFPGNNTVKVPMYGVAFYLQGTQSVPIRNYIFSLEHTVKTQKSNLNLSIALPTIQDQEKKLVEKKSNPSYEITPWYIPPFDIIALKTHAVTLENLSVFSVVALVPFLAGTSIDIGSVCSIQLEQDSSPENGSYLIYSMDHHVNNGSFYTKLIATKLPEAKI